MFAQPRCEHKLPRDRITSGEMPQVRGPSASSPNPPSVAISVDDASYPPMISETEVLTEKDGMSFYSHVDVADGIELHEKDP